LARNYYFYIALLLTIAITIGSLVSLKNVIVETKIVSFDKILHLSAYFLLTFSWLLTFKKSSKIVITSVKIASIVFIYGIIIEALQGILTSNREADLYDLLANFGGIVTAYLFFNVICQKNQ
jgi:VanZ family protein